MTRSTKTTLGALAGCLLATPAFAYNNLPLSGDMPDVVHLSVDCAATNSNLKNCASDVAELFTWVWATRQPSASDPLAIVAGAGTFNTSGAGNVICDGTSISRGHVSIKGAGKDSTVFTRTGVGAVMSVTNCSRMTFQDFTIDGGGNNTGIGWYEGGDSVWTNVDVINAGIYAWIDDCPATGAKSLHYWYASKLISIGKGQGYQYTYRSRCGETWFYGGEVVALDDNGENSGSTLVAVYADGGKGDVRLFGSSVRSIRTANSSASYTVINGVLLQSGLLASNGGMIHMHGGIVNASALNPNNNQSVVGASISTSGMIHTPETAFNVVASGSGVAVRLSGVRASSPFQWPAGNNPPTIVSQNGSDTFVETDCLAGGDCDAGTGTETHFMIYNDSCTVSGPWFDSSRGKCRGAP